MAYTSKAQMITRWGSEEVLRSADRDPQDGTADDATIAAHCDDASSLVDSYLAKAGYATPVDPAPAVLTLKATDIAIYTLSFEVGGPYTEEKRRRYEDALRWLEAVASGKVDLPGGVEPEAGSVFSAVRSSGDELKYQAGNTRGSGGGLL